MICALALTTLVMAALSAPTTLSSGDLIVSAYRIVPDGPCVRPLGPLCPELSTLLVYGNDGTFKFELASGEGLAFGESIFTPGRILYVTSSSGIYRFDAAGNQLGVLAGFCPRRHLVMSIDGRFIGSTDSFLCARSPEGGTIAIRDSFDSEPARIWGGIDLAADQCTAYYQASRGLARWNVCTNSEPEFLGATLKADGLTTLRLLPDGSFLATYRFSNNSSDTGGVARLNHRGEPVRTYALDGRALALDPDGEHFWAVSGNRVVKVNLLSGLTVTSVNLGSYSVRAISTIDEPRLAFSASSNPALTTAALAALALAVAVIALRRLA